MSSVVESEYGSYFKNDQKSAPMWVTLYEMGHTQPATPTQVNILCAAEIENNVIKPKQSKEMDKWLHWICDRINQFHYMVYWRPGYTNKLDYYTKHHTQAHNRYVRYNYLHKENAITDKINNMRSLQGCIHLPILQQTNQIRTVK